MSKNHHTKAMISSSRATSGGSGAGYPIDIYEHVSKQHLSPKALQPTAEELKEHDASDRAATTFYTRVEAALDVHRHRLSLLEKKIYPPFIEEMRFVPALQQEALYRVRHPRVQRYAHHVKQVETIRDRLVTQLRALATPAALAWYGTTPNTTASYEDIAGPVEDPTQRARVMEEAYERLIGDGYRLRPIPDNLNRHRVADWITRECLRFSRDDKAVEANGRPYSDTNAATLREDVGNPTPLVSDMSALAEHVVAEPEKHDQQGIGEANGGNPKPPAVGGGQSTKALSPSPLDEYTFSEDFTSADWFGTRYTFSKGNQAQAVRVLLEAWEAGEHSLSQETIGRRIESAAGRFEMRKTFRRMVDGKYAPHPAWGTMIQHDGKGCYRLARPNSG